MLNLCGCQAPYCRCNTHNQLTQTSFTQRNRGKGIDYNAEVAFEKKPAPGFYDTGEETEATKSLRQEFRPVTIEEMEGKRRKVCFAQGSVYSAAEVQACWGHISAV